MNNKKEKDEVKIKKKNEKIITFNLIEVIIIILMTALVAGVTTGIVVYKNYNKIETVGLSSKTNYLKELENVYRNILNSYVEKVDEKELVNAAIKGMYNFLGDPYTSYLDESTREDLTDRLNGYKGIGVEITKAENGILVANVFKDGPADLAGLEINDIIIKINEEDVSNSTAADAQSMIKNSKKDIIALTVLRGGNKLDINVTVQEVHVPTIEKNKFDNIGYIKITSFANNTAEQFEKALEELENENINSLIIDVRNNGGGYLNAAVEIAEQFIEKGQSIYGLETKNGVTFYSDRTKTSRNFKVEVLMNEGSASASEILAAALKESYNATLIGTKSYGKGTVQETRELNSGGMVKYTTAYWLTPKGNKIDGIGLVPDIEIDGQYNSGMTLDEDVQLQKAIDELK